MLRLVEANQISISSTRLTDRPWSSGVGLRSVIMLKSHAKDLGCIRLVRARLIRITFSDVLDDYGMVIITFDGYPIQKCDCLTGCRNGIGTHRRGGHTKTDLEIDGPSGPNLRKGDTLWG